MKRRSLVAKSLFTGTKLPEVLRGLGNRLSIETDDDTTELLITVSNIKVNLNIKLSVLLRNKVLGFLPCW